MLLRFDDRGGQAVGVKGGEVRREPQGQAPKARREGALGILQDNRPPLVAGHAKRRIERERTEVGNARGSSQRFPSPLSEEFFLVPAMRAAIPPHVLEDAEHRHPHLLEQTEATARVEHGELLGGGHHHDAGDGDPLGKREVDVARARRQIDQKVVKRRPIGLQEDLLESLGDHGPTPSNGGVVGNKEGHAHHPKAVRLKRFETPAIAAVGAGLGEARETGQAGPVNVRVENAHPGPEPGERQGEVVGHGRLSHPTLRRRDGHKVGHVPKTGPVGRHEGRAGFEHRFEVDRRHGKTTGQRGGKGAQPYFPAVPTGRVMKGETKGGPPTRPAAPELGHARQRDTGPEIVEAIKEGGRVRRHENGHPEVCGRRRRSSGHGSRSGPHAGRARGTRTVDNGSVSVEDLRMRADPSPAPRRPAPDLVRPFAALLDEADGILLGKRATLTLALAGILAEGHLLLEDHPGTGKTLLAATLAHLLGLGFRRLQFTSDLLPADIVGSQVYSTADGSFRFVPGPLFTPFLLADEINRATPRTQSALLEAMEERQATVDGVTHPLPRPFVVVATQNPGEQAGTYPLPESQLDRFLLRLELGYPDPAHEKALWGGEDPRGRLARLRPRTDAGALLAAQAAVRTQPVSPAVLDYVARLVARTRGEPALSPGLSPRAGRALVAAARAHAFLAGRGAPWPDDVKAVFVAAAAHRLGREGAAASAARLRAILETTAAA